MSIMRRRGRGGRIALVLGGCLAMIALLTACGSSGSQASGGSSSKPSGTVIVLAAASLNGAFDKLGGQFEKMHPGVTMKFSYAGSSSIATQIKQGAQADLFASANNANMDAVTSDNLASGRRRHRTAAGLRPQGPDR
jgi:molybdate transport system substrate-binding protein